MAALMRFGTEAAGPIPSAAPARANLPANEILADGSGGPQCSGHTVGVESFMTTYTDTVATYLATMP